jgi:hypothetical protein
MILTLVKVFTFRGADIKVVMQHTDRVEGMWPILRLLEGMRKLS